MLRLLLDEGAEPVGDPKQCHAVAIDARAPKFDGGIVTRLDCMPLGIVVNRLGERFYDEGEDLWPKRYAIWGRLVAQQPGSDCLFDHRLQSTREIHALSLSRDSWRYDSGTGRESGLCSPTRSHALSTGLTDAVRPGTFDHELLDDCRTCGLTPEKSHWARAIDTPPFLGYPLRPGITFTYLGVKVNRNAQVLMRDGRPASNIFAAGEIMAGNILGKGYLGGLGMAHRHGLRTAGRKGGGSICPRMN